MYIVVTHVDAVTKIPCNIAPMSHGPSFPPVKGLNIKWANQSEWPTDYPLFYGTCDDDADITIQGVIKQLTEGEYLSLRANEHDLTAINVRRERDYRLRAHIDTVNPIRWEILTEDEKIAIKAYRQALLDVPSQEGFPWDINWPEKP